MEWYYANHGQRQGPVSPEDFARLVAGGTVREDTLVWRAGMSAWQPWREVAPTVQLPPVEQLPPTVPTETVVVAAPARPAVRYGGFWIRLLAKIIDAIALGIIGNIISLIFLGGMMQGMESFNPENPEDVARMFMVFGQLFLIGLLLGLAYNWFFLAKFAATPGKLALGLRVVRGDGSALSHGRIVARFFAEYLSGFILYIGYIIAAFDDEKRTLHDYICDTRVVKR